MYYVNSKSKVMKSVATAALTPLEAALPVLSIRSKRVLREIIAVLNQQPTLCALYYRPVYRCSLKVCMWGVITAFLYCASLEGNRTSCLIKRKQILYLLCLAGYGCQATFCNTMIQTSSVVLWCFVLACVGLITEGLALIDLVAFLWLLWSVGITYHESTISLKFNSVCS